MIQREMFGLRRSVHPSVSPSNRRRHRIESENDNFNYFTLIRLTDFGFISVHQVVNLSL